MKPNRSLMVGLAVVAGWAALWMARPSEVRVPASTPTHTNPLADLGVEPLSLHGQTDVNRELARYIADSIEYVSPGG